MKKFAELYDFVDRAIKSRKYPDNTGMALKTALKLFEAELNDEERNSVSEFSKNLEQIYQNVFSKNNDFTASSLATYKSRVIKVLADYEKYGIDPTKIANWLPKIRKHSQKQSPLVGTRERLEEKSNSRAGNGSSHIFDFVGGVQLIIPKTNKFTEAIMDGALKQINVELKKFSEEYRDEESQKINSGDQ